MANRKQAPKRPKPVSKRVPKQPTKPPTKPPKPRPVKRAPEPAPAVDHVPAPGHAQSWYESAR